MGVDLYSKMKADSQKIHNAELSTGGWATAFTFTKPDDSASQIVNGNYNDIGLLLNPDTGMPITGSKIGCSVSLNDFTLWNKIESLDRWKVSMVNNAGLTCAGELRNVFPDFTFNDLAFTIVLNDGGRT